MHTFGTLGVAIRSKEGLRQKWRHNQRIGFQKQRPRSGVVGATGHAMKVGRVIARPFVGNAQSGFVRTPNRRDFAILPPAPVLTNWVQEAGGVVHAIGKIGDIFSMQGVDDLRKGDDSQLMVHLSDLVDEAVDHSLTFANFVEFDSRFGHRRDIAGYAAALEGFDAALGPILGRLRKGDIMVFGSTR